MKREATDIVRLARQIAGQANAAHGEPVLLLVGVDEREGIVGTQPFEVGDWYATLRARFENGEAPALEYSNYFPVDGKTVAGFVFATDNAPYVIGEGKKGGPREVLWRYGSNSGPAGRRELLQILLPTVANPEIEIQKATVQLGDAAWASAEFFVYPRKETPELFIPFHRVEVQVVADRQMKTVFSSSLSLRPRSPESSAAKVGDGALTIPSPCRLRISAKCEAPVHFSAETGEMELRLILLPAHFESPLILKQAKKRCEKEIETRKAPCFNCLAEERKKQERGFSSEEDRTSKNSA